MTVRQVIPPRDNRKHYKITNQIVKKNEVPLTLEDLNVQGSIYADPQDQIYIQFDLVDAEGVLSEVSGLTFKCPSQKITPIKKVLNEIFFKVNITDGVLSGEGVFPESGHWILPIDGFNKALRETGVNWFAKGADVSFIV